MFSLNSPIICAHIHSSVGDAAKNAFASNPQNTVFDAKRLIGRKFDEPELQKDMKHWPFSVVNRGGKPVISVKHHGEDREFVRTFSLILLWRLAHRFSRPPRRSPLWFSAR